MLNRQKEDKAKTGTIIWEAIFEIISLPFK